jgi:nucleotide-binding universal stress UspA family protein
MQPNPEERVIWPSVHLETILVPTDLRPDSKAALFFAQALAQKFETNLILLHVFSETYSSDAEVDAGEARLLDMTREDAVREVARLEQQLRDQYSKCRSAFRIGSPFEQSRAKPQNLKASLIVMASHCYGCLKELFLDEDLFSALEEIDLNRSPAAIGAPKRCRIRPSRSIPPCTFCWRDF